MKEFVGLRANLKYTLPVVGGIMAMNMDRDWGVQASMHVSSMMEGQSNREMVCRGRVLLDRCQVMVRQPTLAKFVCTFETVSWLVREGFATITKNLKELLYKMAELSYKTAGKAGIPILEVREESLDASMVEDGVEVKSRTAFLHQDEVVTVYTSPSHFYFHRVVFFDINKLEKDIIDWVEKENISSYNFRPKEEEIILVRAEGETFLSRVRVVRILGSRQVEEEDAEPILLYYFSFLGAHHPRHQAHLQAWCYQEFLSSQIKARCQSFCLDHRRGCHFPSTCS